MYVYAVDTCGASFGLEYPGLFRSLVINSCLVHQTQHNPNMIYTIFYKKISLRAGCQKSSFSGVMICLPVFLIIFFPFCQDLTGNIMIVLVSRSRRRRAGT